MQLTIGLNDTIKINFEHTDGEIEIAFGPNALEVKADLPDTLGREGVIYSEAFGTASYHKDGHTLTKCPAHLHNTLKRMDLSDLDAAQVETLVKIMNVMDDGTLPNAESYFDSIENLDIDADMTDLGFSPVDIERLDNLLDEAFGFDSEDELSVDTSLLYLVNQYTVNEEVSDETGEDEAYYPTTTVRCYDCDNALIEEFEAPTKLVENANIYRRNGRIYIYKRFLAGVLEVAEGYEVNLNDGALLRIEPAITKIV